MFSLLVRFISKEIETQQFLRQLYQSGELMDALECETELAKCTEHSNLLLCVLDSDNIYLQTIVLPPLLAAFLDKNGISSAKISAAAGKYHIWLVEGGYNVGTKQLEQVIDLEHAIVCFYDVKLGFWQPMLSDFGDFESVVDRSFGRHWRHMDCWLFAAEDVVNESRIKINRNNIIYLGNYEIHK